jgi:hypothetical protein
VLIDNVVGGVQHRVLVSCPAGSDAGLGQITAVVMMTTSSWSGAEAVGPLWQELRPVREQHGNEWFFGELVGWASAGRFPPGPDRPRCPRC